MAAYAALVSLMNTVEQIQTDRRYSVSLDKKQIESLGETVAFLEHFVETHSNDGGPEAEVLESEIASAAHAAEDIIEMHILDQIQADSVSLLDLQKVIEDMESVKETVMKVGEERGLIKDLLPSHSSPAAASSTLAASGKSELVGSDAELIQLMDMLTGQQPSRQIIPITGMGGIGKTMLTRSAYEHLLIKEYFDVRLWVAISQEYSLRGILLGLISCIEKPTSELNQKISDELGEPFNKSLYSRKNRILKFSSGLDKKTEEELGDLLYKSLFGRRYMVVMDDMWSIKAWEGVRRFFPDTNNGSRIVVTTRESNLATHLGSAHLQKEFLDEGASWSLFCEKAFPQKCYPPELEAIGKKIVKKCGGLPLSIVVIGGLLGKSSRTREYWENVERDMNSISLLGIDGQSLDILSLSYRYLPSHLRPCFLYMGIFPEDYGIHVTALVHIWVAEGFIKSTEAKSLEEVAEGNFLDLVDRNLIIVRGLRKSGKIKTCYIHDLLRDLCLKLAEKEKFLSIMTSLDIPRDVRRTVYHGKEKHWFDLFDNVSHSAAPLARSLITSSNRPRWSRCKLLRVLHVFGESGGDPNFQQYNLRYISHPSLLLSRTSFSSISLLRNVQKLILRARGRISSVSLLWNVQTLIIRARGTHHFPSHLIWQMPNLRHLKIKYLSLPDPPPPQCHQEDGIVLENLHTLQLVRNFKLSEEVCKRIPNLKKLKMEFNDTNADHYCLYNLDRLHKLESLNCSFLGNVWKGLGDLQKLPFPTSLKKLTLIWVGLCSENLRMIGRLPHLEVLVLKMTGLLESEWNPVEGGFPRLKFLEFWLVNLEEWNVDSSHFPVLETLHLEYMEKLPEIPLGVGEIPTLRLIYLEGCSESAGISAVRILEEQESLGNEDLQVLVEFRDEVELKRFRERMEEEVGSFTSNNLHLNKHIWPPTE